METLTKLVNGKFELTKENFDTVFGIEKQRGKFSNEELNKALDQENFDDKLLNRANFFADVLGDSYFKVSTGGGTSSKEEVLKILEGVLTRSNRFNKKMSKKLKMLDFIGKEIVILKRKRLDVWTPSKRSQKEQYEFKKKLINFYGCEDPKNSNNLFCMVLDQPFERTKVIAAHLWKYSTYGEGLDEFGLKADDVSSPRNGIIIADGIEAAFDSKQLCFIYDPLALKLKVFVLDPNILEEKVSPSPSTLFKEIIGAELHHPEGHFPFRRILAWHARCCFKIALAKKWIDQNKFCELEDYITLSEDAIEPDLDELDELDSIQSN